MLDIIIYSDNMTTIKKSDKAINMALVNYEFEYNRYIFNKYVSLSDNNKKIYIIDISNQDYCNIASKIRENDFSSIIILVNVNYNNMFLNKRLMVLDFILENDEYIERLSDDINISLKIFYGEDIFVFKYNHVIYRIPCNDINYIEKEPSVKRCIIHTMNKEYYIINSIEKIINDLNLNFIKTHQSCIINMNNVSELDYGNNVIFFKNGDFTSLLTDKVKKYLKNVCN